MQNPHRNRHPELPAGRTGVSGAFTADKRSHLFWKAMTAAIPLKGYVFSLPSFNTGLTCSI